MERLFSSIQHALTGPYLDFWGPYATLFFGPYATLLFWRPYRSPLCNIIVHNIKHLVLHRFNDHFIVNSLVV